MGIDISRIATSALQAALEDGQQSEPKQHRRRLTAGKAIVGGAALAVAAKYAVDKTSPLKRKAAMAAVRHTVRNTFGDVIPESLHDKLMDVGFFDNDEEEFFDAPEGEERAVRGVRGAAGRGARRRGELLRRARGPGARRRRGFFDEPESEEPEEPESEESESRDEDEEDVEEPEDEDVDEPEDEDVDEPEDEESTSPSEVDEDDEPEDDEDDEPEDEPVDEPDGDAEGEPADDVDSTTSRATRRAPSAPPAPRPPMAAPKPRRLAHGRAQPHARRRRRTRRPRVDLRRAAARAAAEALVQEGQGLDKARQPLAGGKGADGTQHTKDEAGQDASGDVDRYRRAAEDALQQLDWAIGYLHGIRKTEISRALAKNRAHIRTQPAGRAGAADPGPADQTRPDLEQGRTAWPVAHSHGATSNVPGPAASRTSSRSSWTRASSSTPTSASR